MGKFTDQMASLTESVVASNRDRTLTVKDMLSESGLGQASMAHQQKSSLADECGARTRQVNSMRRENREEQQRMAHDLRSGLAQAINKISISGASLRAGASKEHAAMANEQKKQFTKDSQARVKGNDRLMSELRGSRQNMAQALSKNLERFTLSIRNETDVMLGGFKQAHIEMAGSLQKRLSANTATIRRDVTELRRGLNEAQNELRDDMQAAAQIWSNRNSRVSAMSDQPSQVAAKAEGVGFGMAEKAIKRFGFGAGATEEALDHPETETKSQPSKHESKMSNEEKVLQVVRENPNGISASHIGERVSLRAPVVGKIMKELIEKGKALKDDGTRLYTLVKGG
ncbi:MAG: putative transcriptional regulator [Litorivivens sp.]|jgi:DNA-binding IclR family transcriptional regulator